MGIDTISTAKDEILLAKIETTFGTLVYPVGTDVVPLLGEASFKAPRTFIPDPQKRMSISQMARLALGYEPGEFSFNMMIKPSGTLGTPPRGYQLLQALFGIYTNTPATSDVFSLAGISADILGVSMVHRFGHRVTWNSGCVVNKGVFGVKATNTEDALGQVTLSGQFCKQIQAGYDYVNGALLVAATDIVVDDERSFDVGAKIQFRNATTGVVIDDNAGAGFTILTVTPATHTITIAAPGLINAVADDSIVDGFVPTVSDAGIPAFGRLGYAQECDSGGTPANILIMDAQVDIDNSFKIKSDEKTGVLWPISAIRAANRVIAYTCNKVFLKGEALYYAESNAQTQKEIALPVGDTAAERYRFDIGQAVFDTPELSGAEELIIGRRGTALATATDNDELTLTFD